MCHQILLQMAGHRFSDRQDAAAEVFVSKLVARELAHVAASQPAGECLLLATFAAGTSWQQGSGRFPPAAPCLTCAGHSSEQHVGQ